MRTATSFVLLCCLGIVLFYGSADDALSANQRCGVANYDGATLNVEKSLNCANEALYPAGSDVEASGILSFLCNSPLGGVFQNALGEQLIACEGTKTRDMTMPASVEDPDGISAEELEALELIADYLESDVAGTQTGEVLAWYDNINLPNYLCDLYNRSLVGGNSSGWTTAQEPAGHDFSQGDRTCPFNATKNDSGGMLWPASSSIESSPTPTPGSRTPPFSGSTCPFGTGYCDTTNLQSSFSTELGAQQASIICQQESTSNPGASNKTCKNPDGSLDYSIGLFQINLLAHCSSNLLSNFSSTGYSGPSFNARDVFQYAGDSPVFPCVVLDQQKLDMCEEAMLVAENNIAYAVSLSQDANKWTDWSAAEACGIVANQPLPSPAPVIPPPSIEGCPDQSQWLGVPGTQYQPLPHASRPDFSCRDPAIIVVHWSASWTDPQATFNTLAFERDRSCEFALDENYALQMMNFYPLVEQHSWCVGGDYNNRAISLEITGSYFDDVITNPGHPYYQKLIAETDRAVDLACWAIGQYNLNSENIYGHFELIADKLDPGPQYLAFFKDKVRERCPNAGSSGPIGGGEVVNDASIRSGAQRIYDGIFRECKNGVNPNVIHGQVLTENRDCMANVSPPFSAHALNTWLVSSRSDLKNLQCVGLVEGAKYEVQGETITLLNAYDNWNTPPAGYKQATLQNGDIPLPGDMVVWDIGKFGHIAYIMEVLDNDTVTVLEANWDASGNNIRGLVRTRTVELVNPSIRGWLTPEKRT